MAVVKHGAVDYAFMVFCKMLQILVVGGNHSESPFLVETFQYSFGNGTSNLRLRTSSELINQDEATFIATFHHYLHIGEVRGVGTQIVFDRLFITDIYENAAEYTCMTAFVQRDQHSALKHILQ